MPSRLLVVHVASSERSQVHGAFLILRYFEFPVDYIVSIGSLLLVILRSVPFIKANGILDEQNSFVRLE